MDLPPFVFRDTKAVEASAALARPFADRDGRTRAA
jgi:hypothetical protein